MHELALAEAIVRTVTEHAGGDRVAKVELRVGHLRQVVPGALAFAFEVVAKGTPAEGAELEIEAVPVRVACRACGAESDVDGFPLSCPACGSGETDVVAGEELLVEAIELERV
jgi:hydrogenase nickel incorporation protein HypA/HybF